MLDMLSISHRLCQGLAFRVHLTLEFEVDKCKYPQVAWIHLAVHLTRCRRGFRLCRRRSSTMTPVVMNHQEANFTYHNVLRM